MWGLFETCVGDARQFEPCVGRMWTIDREDVTGRAAAGGPVLSIRKNSVLPGSSSTDSDLHYGKNGDILSNEPARPAAARPVSNNAGGQAAGGSAVRLE